MAILTKISIAIVALGVGLASFPIHATQVVSPQTEVLFVAPESPLSSTVNYSVSAPEDGSAAGLGLRVHFDSSRLSFTGLGATLQKSFLAVSDVQPDTNDYDNDAITDSFFLIAWVDLATSWPGSGESFPLALLTGNFASKSDFHGSSKINFTAASTSGEAAFTATSQLVCHKPEVHLAADTPELAEGNTAHITVSLDEALPVECGPLPVTVTTVGTATPQSDYTLGNLENGLVQIGAGQLSAGFTLTALSDNLGEGDENISIGLQKDDRYQLAQNASVTLTIRDSQTQTGAAAHNIPTLSEWALILLSISFSLWGVITLRNRREGGRK